MSPDTSSASMDAATPDPRGGRQPPAPADPPACENCGALLAGPFCAACGQASGSPTASVRAFLAHTLNDVVSLDSRLLRSLRALLFRPGVLTREYLDGHRVRWTGPVQLYLLAAAAFFFMASYRPFLWVDVERRQIVGALPGMTVTNDVARERLAAIEEGGGSLELFGERFIDAVNAYLPAFLVGSVALFSLVLWLANRRLERRYLPHALLALHWTAFYLTALALTRLFPPAWRLENLSLLAGLVWLAVALKRVYGQRPLTAAAKAFGLVLAFLLTLVVWMQSAVALALLAV